MKKNNFKKKYIEIMDYLTQYKFMIPLYIIFIILAILDNLIPSTPTTLFFEFIQLIIIWWLLIYLIFFKKTKGEK